MRPLKYFLNDLIEFLVYENCITQFTKGLFEPTPFSVTGSIDPSFVLEKHHVPGGDQTKAAGAPGGRSLTMLKS